MSIIDLIWFSNNLKHFYIFNYLKTCLIRLHISSFCNFVTSPWKIHHLSCICYLVIPADGANLRIPWLLQEFWEIKRSLKNPSGFQCKSRHQTERGRELPDCDDLLMGENVLKCENPSACKPMFNSTTFASLRNNHFWARGGLLVNNQISFY